MIKNKIYNFQMAKDKGYTFKKFLEKFVEPLDMSLKPEAITFATMDKIVSKILQAIKDNKKLVILGDYDVDGITSSAILYKAIKALNGDVEVILPDRFLDGYGASNHLIEKAQNMGADLLITVDNGINAIPALSLAKTLDIDVIITDHHIPNDDSWKFFKEYTMNPHCIDSNLKNKGVCGAYVALILAIHLLGKESSLIPELKELASIGTVADCMEIAYENRTLLAEMQENWKKGIIKNKGINLLINTLNKFDLKDMEQENIGFYLAPCLNASGRLRTADDSFAILTEPFSKSLCEKALDLVSLNVRRQDLTNQASAILTEKINLKNEVQIINFKDSTLDASPREMEGIIGLIAQKCVDLSNCPSLIFYGDKFSGRSLPDVDLHKLVGLTAKKVPSLSYGGHVGACGGKINFDKEYQAFQDALNKSIEEASFEVTVPYIRIPKDSNFKELYDAVESLKPCKDLPSFIMDDLNVIGHELVGDKHSKLIVDLNGKRMDVLKFNEKINIDYIKRLVFRPALNFMGGMSLFAEKIIN